jgi:hypothetical protein
MEVALRVIIVEAEKEDEAVEYLVDLLRDVVDYYHIDGVKPIEEIGDEFK